MPEPSLNSALYWFPRIQHLTPTPETRFVAYSQLGWGCLMEGMDDEWLKRGVVGATRLVTAAADEMGYPLFIRSDQTSAKHSGPSAYKAEGAADLPRVLSATVEDNELKLWMDPEQPSAFMLRRFVELNSMFTAFGSHPIANEWRYFVRNGKIVCVHFYWPTETIKFYGGREPPRWRSQLRTLRTNRPDWEVALRAKRAGQACSAHDFWSVDFAQDRGGRWWLIDMAVGERSWHPDDCRYNPKAAANG